MGGHWWMRRKRGYERINGSGQRRTKNVQLGSSPERQKRRGYFWRIKNKPKFKFLKMASPKKLLACLRDAYVKMMLGIANSRATTTGVWGVGDGINSFGMRPKKEYDDDKVIIEIYKSVVGAQDGQLISRPPASDSARFGGPASNNKLAVIME